MKKMVDRLIIVIVILITLSGNTSVNNDYLISENYYVKKVTSNEFKANIIKSNIRLILSEIKVIDSEINYILNNENE
jgi:uncharacterized protein YxeA